MKISLIAPILAVFIMSSCQEVSSYFNKKSLEGSYKSTQDGLIEELHFGDKMCRFTYLYMPMSGEYEVEKGYVYIKTNTDLGVLALEIIDKNTLVGEGWIKGTFVKE